MKITVLRSASCVEGDTCPLVARDEDDPTDLYLVVKPVTDPATLAAFSSRIGPGEILSTFPAAMLPEVC